MHKRIPMIALIGVIIFALLLAACGGGDATEEPVPDLNDTDDTTDDQPADTSAGDNGSANEGSGGSQPPLVDTRWILVSLNGSSPIQGTRITLNITSPRVFRGKAGCNDYGAEYSVDDGNITVSGLQFTEIACSEPAGVMEQEQQYLSFVEAASSLTVEGGQLQMLTADGAVLIFDRR